MSSVCSRISKAETAVPSSLTSRECVGIWAIVNSGRREAWEVNGQPEADLMPENW